MTDDNSTTKVHFPHGSIVKVDDGGWLRPGMTVDYGTGPDFSRMVIVEVTDANTITVRPLKWWEWVAYFFRHPILAWRLWRSSR